MHKHERKFDKIDSKFIAWNEQMFIKYNNERMYFHPNPLIRWLERKRVRHIVRLSQATDYTNILEIGCGEGFILNQFPKGQLYGIDVSNKAIELAKNRTKSNTRVKEVSVQNGERTSYPNGMFDVVVCSEVLEHVPHPQKVIQEMMRVAKPNGKLIMTFPNEPLINLLKDIIGATGLYKVLLRGVPKRMDDEWHLHEFDKKTFLKLAAGKLRIEKLSGVPLPFMPVRYAALCRKLQPLK